MEWYSMARSVVQSQYHCTIQPTTILVQLDYLYGTRWYLVPVARIPCYRLLTATSQQQLAQTTCYRLLTAATLASQLLAVARRPCGHYRSQSSYSKYWRSRLLELLASSAASSSSQLASTPSSKLQSRASGTVEQAIATSHYDRINSSSLTVLLRPTSSNCQDQFGTNSKLLHSIHTGNKSLCCLLYFEAVGKTYNTVACYSLLLD